MDNEGAIIIDEGGAGGGTDDAGRSDDSEIIESETIDSEGDEPEGDGTDEGIQGGDDEGERRGTRPTEAGAVRKALREILADNEELGKKFPRLEKDVVSALFSRGEINKLGGIRAVSELLEKIDARGGIEQIETDYEDLEKSRELEQGLERGDPAVIAGWAKDFPDGFKRAVLPMFEQLEKLDEARGEQVGSAVWTRMSDRFGVFDAIASIGSAIQSIKADDPARAELVKHFNGLAKFARDAKATGERVKQDPYAARSEELDRREQQISEKDKQAFHSAVRTEVGNQVIREMNRMLVDKLRSMKVHRVPSSIANRIRNNVTNEVKRQLSADPSYAREYNRIAATGDRERAIRFIIGRSAAKLPKAIAAVLPDFNLKPTGKAGGKRTFGGKRDEGGRNASGSGPETVTGRPKTSDVDFTRTDKANWLGHVSSGFSNHGQAYLKNGKIAKW